MCTCLLRPVLASLRARLSGGCKPPDMGAGNWGPLGKRCMLLTDVPTFQSLMCFLILISVLCAKDLQFLPLFSFLRFWPWLQQLLSSVVPSWDKLAAHMKRRAFWPWVGMKTVGQRCRVCCAAFSLWDIQWRRQCHWDVSRDSFRSLRTLCFYMNFLLCTSPERAGACLSICLASILFPPGPTEWALWVWV